MTVTRRWSWAALAALVALELAYVLDPNLATHRLDAWLHAHRLPGRASQVYVLVAGLLGLAYALMVAPSRQPSSASAPTWLARIRDSARSWAASARARLIDAYSRVRAARTRYAPIPRPFRAAKPEPEHTALDDAAIHAGIVAPHPAVALAAAVIGRAIADAAAAGALTVDAAASQRRDDLAGGSLNTPLQGEPMSVITTSDPEPEISSVSESAESLSLPSIPTVVAGPLKQLLNAALAVAESNASKLTPIFASENLKVEDLIVAAVKKQNPLLGDIVGALGSDIVSFLGGEEAAAVIAVEALLAAEIAKI